MSIKSTLVTASISFSAMFSSVGYVAQQINADPTIHNVQTANLGETYNWHGARQFSKRRKDGRRAGMDKTGLDALIRSAAQ